MERRHLPLFRSPSFSIRPPSSTPLATAHPLFPHSLSKQIHFKYTLSLNINEYYEHLQYFTQMLGNERVLYDCEDWK
jgi:hypothetical protein